ncbi:MAG TPA: MMPL family transporter, partial [Paracoccaceae bacterium]|nr:MMPL family transporter [Paracoccaceae bacterium]
PLFAEAAEVFEAHARGERRGFGWASLLQAETAGATGGPVTRVVTVTPELDLTRLSPARPALDVIEAAIADLPPDIAAGVEIGITGEPALRAEELESVFGTIGISTALSLLLVALLLRAALRATGRSVVAMISLVTSLVLTAGFAAAVVGTLNLVSVAFIVLMVGLGVDFAIHILAHIAETRRGGVPPTEAVLLTGRRTGLALCLSMATTALAFLSFSITDFEGMAQLGVIGAAGTIIAFLTAATLIPAVIAFRPRTAGTVDPRREPLPAVRRMRALPYIVLALGLAAIWPATQVRFDADPMALRNPEAPSVQAFQMLAEQPQTTPYRASVLAPSAEAAADIAARFEGVPGVARAVTIQDLIPENQDEKLFLLDIAAPSIQHAVSGQPTRLGSPPEGPALERLQDRLAGNPGAAGRLADRLAAYQTVRTPARDATLTEDLFRSFPLLIGRLEAMLAAGYVTEETLPAELSGRYVSPEGIYRVEVLPEKNLDSPAEISAFAATVQRVAPEATGGPVQLKAAGETVARAVLMATLLSALATSVLAWITTRRVSDTVAILLPLAIAGAITAAASVLLGMPFNYANVIVLPLMLGLGVDSGVHIALRERQMPGAVFATSTPRAVLFSALTTIAAFGTLAVSDHRGTASMGVLLSVALLAAVGSVLGLTPAIMRWMSRR